MKTLTILSGKGGVGKSSITASLSVILSKKEDIVATDCDVDASNLSLILQSESKNRKERKISSSEKVFFDPDKCTSCGKCKDVCAFSAIDWNEEKEMPEINRYLCEGCGTCELVCPEGAFQIKKVKNATISSYDTRFGFPLVSGQLKMGESGSGKVVTEVKREAEGKEADFMVVDSPAGIGCPVIASVRGSDYVIAVTEPTPSGFSDLERVLKIVEHFGIDVGIIINKWNLNKEMAEKISSFADSNGMKLLGKIPYDKKFVESLVNMKTVVEVDPEYKNLFEEILKNIKEDMDDM
ncbi:MAG: P-loop NTPase [Candidatus Aenigmatarchaeota archaeon]